MIKVNDIVDIKEKFDNTLGIPQRNKSDFVHMLRADGIMFPMKVKTIERCASNACDHVECPGWLNGECYGYNEGYILTKIQTDWDSKEN